MAIAELERIGTVDRTPSPAKQLELSPIEKFSEKETRELLRLYYKNIADGKSEDSHIRALALGTAQAQREALEMLGQKHFSLPRKPIYEKSVVPLIKLKDPVRELTLEDLRIFEIKYRKARKYSIDKNPERKIGKGDDSYQEEIIQARVDELSRILVIFGQGNLITAINGELEPPSERINWGQMRNTGHGELH